MPFAETIELTRSRENLLTAAAENMWFGHKFTSGFLVLVSPDETESNKQALSIVPLVYENVEKPSSLPNCPKDESLEVTRSLHSDDKRPQVSLESEVLELIEPSLGDVSPDTEKVETLLQLIDSTHHSLTALGFLRNKNLGSLDPGPTSLFFVSCDNSTVSKFILSRLLEKGIKPQNPTLTHRV